ncbi:ADP-ribosylglycohydrolase family protein [Exiguobacterium sp. SH5S13]|uniref:ADP-ribosylglycohydrolase family protein n=1 Tax=Exiguobacterium sp. SH5S13 TaxID=2510959 RepID=UPI001375D3AB|nr:ADP-ribosylglycohydrolase family protein [Exiguobacterium sp. SH5S13]
MEKSEVERLDKQFSALVCAAVGDALGWPQEQNSKNISKKKPTKLDEFQKWTRQDGGRFWGHSEVIQPGEYSDDTQLIIATARSLKYGSSWGKYFSKVELPAWLSYERGGGGATKRAAEEWRKNKKPWDVEKENESSLEKYFNAGGNGVAMRILPHVFTKENTWAEIQHQVFLNGIFTHGHPRAILGALVYADALMYLQNKNDTLGYGELIEYLIKRSDEWGTFPNVQKLDSWMNAANKVFNNNYLEVWNKTKQEIINQLAIVNQGLNKGALDIGNETLEQLGCFDKKINGAGTVTATAAIYLASKYATSPKTAIVEAAHLNKADTDTLASMVGGLLGILHGTEFLPTSWLSVQDYSYFSTLLNQGTKNEEEIESPLFDCSKVGMKEKLKNIQRGDLLKVEPFGEITLDDVVFYDSNNSQIIKNLKFVSEDGQVIFVKIYERKVLKNNSLKKESVALEKNNSSLKGLKNIDDPHTYKVVIDARKLRGFANLVPEELEFNLCLQLIADIMDEIERSQYVKSNKLNFQIIEAKWKKHNINYDYIIKIANVIQNY